MTDIQETSFQLLDSLAAYRPICSPKVVPSEGWFHPYRGRNLPSAVSVNAAESKRQVDCQIRPWHDELQSTVEGQWDKEGKTLWDAYNGFLEVLLPHSQLSPASATHVSRLHAWQLQ